MKNLELLSLEDQREISGGMKTPNWLVPFEIEAYEFLGALRDGFNAGAK